MNMQKIKKLCWTIMLAIFILMAHDPLLAQQNESATPSPDKETRAEPPPGLAGLVHKATRLNESYTDLQRWLPKIFDRENVEQSISSLSDNLDQLKTKNQSLLLAESRTYRDLAELKSAFQVEARRAEDDIESLTETINAVESRRAQWLAEFERWTLWQKALSDSVNISTVDVTFQRALGIIDDALDLISLTLEPLLSAQQKAEGLRYEIYKLAVDIDAMILAERGDVMEKTPILFSGRFFTDLRRAISYELKPGLSISWPQRQFFIENAWVIILQIIVSLGIAMGCKRHRRRLEQTANWQFVAKRPYAAGVTFALPILSALYGPIPALWRLILWTAGGAALSRLTAGLISDAWKRLLVYGLTGLTIFNQLLATIELPVPVMRLYILLMAIGGMLLLGWRSLVSHRDGAAAHYQWTMRIAAIVFLVMMAAEMIGQHAFAWELLDASSRSVLYLLMAWMLIKLIGGALVLAAQSQLVNRVPLLSRKADAILRHAMVLIHLAIWSVVIANILVDWRLFNLSSDAFNTVLGAGVAVGSQKVSIGLILSALGILYGAFIVSWTIQAVLMENTFGRRDLDRGARISIGRLIHYAAVLMGFILALFALGFDLKNITILGGALGVGIGFGMQTIVNNFVCGLIMLFERPVKVGDAIELSGQWGQIKKVGLRATIVQTYDNSEIVVPNSDLITNQVTNWTLAERLSRIKIPVGVAYGSDVQLVMETLLQCATDNPTVLKSPEPQVLFLNFGGSSLDFELRAWVADFDTRLKVSSELHQEIDRRFRQKNIEIPFPQSDIHVRSINESTANALYGRKTVSTVGE